MFSKTIHMIYIDFLTDLDVFMVVREIVTLMSGQVSVWFF